MTDIELIMQAYQSYGERPKDLPRAFSMYEFKHWRNGSMSPIFLKPEQKFTPDLLHQLELYFQKHPAKYKHDVKNPYFTVPKIKQYNTSSIERMALENSWEVTPRTWHINYFQSLAPCEENKSISIEWGRFFNPYFHQDFWSFHNKSFEDKHSKEFIFDYESAIRLREQNSYIVNLKYKGKLCASGLVTYQGKYAALWGGGVDPKMRKKGLWKTLVHARQIITQPLGVNFWFYSTSNPAILQKGEKSVPFLTLVKK